MDIIPQTISTKSALVSVARHLMATEEYTPKEALYDAVSILGFAEMTDKDGIYAEAIEELTR